MPYSTISILYKNSADWFCCRVLFYLSWNCSSSLRDFFKNYVLLPWLSHLVCGDRRKFNKLIKTMNTVTSQTFLVIYAPTSVTYSCYRGDDHQFSRKDQTVNILGHKYIMFLVDLLVCTYYQQHRRLYQLNW